MAKFKLTPGGKLILKGGKFSCTCCPPDCSAPTLLCATSSASKTKFGYTEFTGFISSPPKRYLVRTWSGARVETSYASAGCTGSSSTDTLAISGSASYDTAGVCTAAFVSTFNGTPTSITNCAATTTWATDITSATTKEDFDRANTGTCQPGNFIIDQADSLDELSDEYTTGENIDNMLAAISATGTLTTCSGSVVIASFSVSSDELTASGKIGTYAFALPASPPACYRITWDEVLTPSSGSPTVTPREYIWDGIATQTPDYNVSAPGDNTKTGGYSATVTLENIEFFCTGCP